MRSQPTSLSRERGADLWLLAAVVLSAVVGAAIVRAPLLAVALLGLAAAFFLAAMPLRWAIYAFPIASLTLRLAAPEGSALVSAALDALLLLTLLRVAANWFLGLTAPLPRSLRWAAVPIVGFVILAVASSLVNGDSALGLVASIRQYLRYPVWALAVLASGVERREAKVLLGILLGIALLQFPIALQQYRSTGGARGTGIFYQGDVVSGTFGQGGSGVMMGFLVLSALVWLSLVLERVIPAWTLLPVMPMLVLPMAWGSAAIFVVLLPLAAIALLVRTALSRQTRLRMRGVIGGVLLVGIAGWAASSIALAPGFAGSGQLSARAILSDRYLSQYFTSTAGAPASRLGFLRFALHADISSGPLGIALGQGPSASIIGAASQPGLKSGLSEFAVEASRSVWSVQRLLLGFGPLGVLLIVVLIGIPTVGLVRQPRSGPTARALAMALPVMGLVFLLLGPYNSAWLDPGLASAYWTFVVLAHAVGGPDRTVLERDENLVAGQRAGL